MMEEIRRAVIRVVGDNFLLPVYGQTVPQGGKVPCFTVELKRVEQKRLLGRRVMRKAVFEIRYFCKEAEAKAAEVLEVTDELYEILLIIGVNEKFAASGMTHEKTADGVKLTAEYEYHLIFDDEEAEMMERLEYNGKEAVGYEEEGYIQQGTAE